MNIFSKINQKILERFPNIWNTKLIWILIISLVIHFAFFLVGFVSHNNPESLQKMYVLDSFFTSGLILANFIISLLILVGWLVYMFKNNAFKNFYPTSSLQLFGQFVQYFIIVFVSTTFYFSYMFGFETYIKNTYPDEIMKEQIDLANRAYPFLSHQPEQYLVTNKQYPKIFSELFCETDSAKINFDKKYYTYYNSFYQFNNVYSVTVKERDSLGRFVYPNFESENKIELAYIDEKTTKCVFYFKKDVADVSKYLKNANLNYANFSEVLYVFGNGYEFGSWYSKPYSEYLPDNHYLDEQTSKQLLQLGIAQNKYVYDMINSNDKQAFQKLFTDFISLADSYKIKHNINSEKWLSLVYADSSFDVKHFIFSEDPENTVITEEIIEEEFPVMTTFSEGNTQENPLITAKREFEKNAQTSYFFESNSLKLIFENIDEIKQSTYFTNTLPFFLWIAFSFSTLIFSFRVTNLRALLFSTITSGIIGLTSGIFFIIISFSAYFDSKFIGLYYFLVLGGLILSIPIFAPNFGSKLFRSILINITINGFIFYVYLIIEIISFHQIENCNYLNETRRPKVVCESILNNVDSNILSYLLIACGFLFILFYANVIKKWKASAE